MFAKHPQNKASFPEEKCNITHETLTRDKDADYKQGVFGLCDPSRMKRDKRQMVKQCLLKAFCHTVSVYQCVTKARRSWHFTRIIEQIQNMKNNPVNAKVNWDDTCMSSGTGQRSQTPAQLCWLASLASLGKKVK